LEGHGPYQVAFSPDGRRLAFGDVYWLTLYDADTGKELAVLKGHNMVGASFSPDGKRVITGEANIWDVNWVTNVYGAELRQRVCAEKLKGAQEFTPQELAEPILRDIDPNNPITRNPCLRRGPLSLDYWTRLPGEMWSKLVAPSARPSPTPTN
jgi:WD40 repeat protein